MTPFRVGVWQCAAAGLPPQARLEALADAMAGQALDLVVCPELFACGYYRERDLPALAEPQDGPFRAGVAALAARTNTAVLYGYAERDGAAIFNAAQAIAPDGTTLANHRKRMNSPGSFEERVFATGDKHTAFTWRGLNLAIVICYEVEFPESVRHAAACGADLVAVPTALAAHWQPVAEHMIPTRAFENGVWIAYANHAGSENGLRYYGGSRIVAPNFTELAVAGPAQSLLTAAIDLSAERSLPYLRDVAKLARSFS